MLVVPLACGEHMSSPRCIVHKPSRSGSAEVAGGSVVNIAYRLSLAYEEINGWFGPIEANSERTKKVHHRLM